MRKILFYMCLAILTAFLCAIGYIFFKHRQKIRQLQLAEKLYQLNTPSSLQTAANIYKLFLQEDENQEIICQRLAEIAEKQDNPPESVYYRKRVHSLNPLDGEHQQRYIQSLKRSRQFLRLETFINTLPAPTEEQQFLRLYAGLTNGNRTLYLPLLNKLRRNPPKTPLTELISTLAQAPPLSDKAKFRKLNKLSQSQDLFIRQESLMQLYILNVEKKHFLRAEKNLLLLLHENFYIGAPELAKFNATFRSFQQAIPLYQKYLKKFHDPLQAVALAEIYALLKNEKALQDLQNSYQKNPQRLDMYTCFYFNALLSFIRNDLTELRSNLEPIQKIFHFPLVKYMTLCAEIQTGTQESILKSFEDFTRSRRYLDLPERASMLTENYLAQELDAKKTSPALFRLAEQLHRYHPTQLTTKLQLFLKLQNNTLSAYQMQEALKTFPDNPGLWKIALELALKNEPAKALEILQHFLQKFPGQEQSILDQEIKCLLLNKKDDQAAALFKKALTPERYDQYWQFAVQRKRREDLEFLKNTRGAELYHPFCQAALLLDSRPDEALDILQKAPVDGNLMLLFHAASTLASHGRHREALKRYEEFPPDSPYDLLVLINTAEIQLALGNPRRSLQLAREAWERAPGIPDIQLCYADKLFRLKHEDKIYKVIQLPTDFANTPPRLKELWSAGIKAQLKNACMNEKWNIAGEFLKTLASQLPDDPTVRTYQELIQQKQSQKNE